MNIQSYVLTDEVLGGVVGGIEAAARVQAPQQLQGLRAVPAPEPAEPAERILAQPAPAPLLFKEPASAVFVPKE